MNFISFEESEFPRFILTVSKVSNSTSSAGSKSCGFCSILISNSRCIK